MKKLIYSLCITLLLGVSSCKYDDTYLSKRVENLEQRVTNIEVLCQEINTNITSLQNIFNVMESNDYITAVNPLYEGDIQIGYEIEFAKSETITIYHGKDGKDGADGIDGTNGADGKDGLDGYTPKIGVKQDETDGLYYWTLDGDWLLNEKGEKVLAQGLTGSTGNSGSDGSDGKDGITPQFKIENEDWFVSLDEGKTWRYLGQATGDAGQDGQDGQDGDSLFSNIDSSNPDYVIFTLVDGTTIQIPTWYAFNELKEYCTQMNNNIESLQTIVEAIEDGDYITSCLPLMENGVQVGYTITFAKGGSINIYHGVDGQDGIDGRPGQNGDNGEDGHTPQISVKADTDGVLYWTVDGEWLKDETGNKVPVTGKNGKDGTDGKDGENGQNGKDGAGGTTQAKIKSLILTELAIFLLVTTGRSHYNSHYLNRYKPR